MANFTAAHIEYRKNFQSYDYKKRVNKEILSKLHYEHISTAQDSDIYADAIDIHGLNVSAAGYTEWKAEWKAVNHGALISLAWDWFVHTDRNPRILSITPPRTNLRLIETKGYDMNDAATNEQLFQIIESLGWQAHVRSLLRDRSHTPAAQRQ